MALRSREGFVGKRFVSLKSGEVRKFGESAGGKRLKEENWRCGVIRASTHVDYVENKDFKILVEYDGREWKRREWVSVQTSLCLLLVETSLVWVDNKPSARRPALTFRTVVDKVGYVASQSRATVEYLVDRKLDFVHKTTLRDFKKSDLEAGNLETLCIDQSSWSLEVACIRRWIESQDGQRILIETPSVLVGYRVQVYRADGTTQWYTAVIKSYNEKNQMLIVTDDTVLEEHQVNPTLTQIILLGEGVIESILNGEEPSARLCRGRRCKNDRKSDVTKSSASKSFGRPGRVKGETSESKKVTPSTEAVSDSSASETLLPSASKTLLPLVSSDAGKTSQAEVEEKSDLKKSKNLNKSADEFCSDLSVIRSIVKLNRLNSVDSADGEPSSRLCKADEKPQRQQQQTQQRRQQTQQQLALDKCKYDKLKLEENKRGSSFSQDSNKSESETSRDRGNHHLSDKKLCTNKQLQTSVNCRKLGCSHKSGFGIDKPKQCKDRKSRRFFEIKSHSFKSKLNSTVPSSESKSIYSEFEFKGEENSLDSCDVWAPATKRLSESKSKAKRVGETDVKPAQSTGLPDRAPSETDSASTEEAVLDAEVNECDAEPEQTGSETSRPPAVVASELIKEEKFVASDLKQETLCKEEFPVESKLDMGDKKTPSGIDINQPLTDQFIMTQRLRSTPPESSVPETRCGGNNSAPHRPPHIDISKMVERAISENIEKELRNSSEDKVDSSGRQVLAEPLRYSRMPDHKEINSIISNNYRNSSDSVIRTMSEVNRSERANPQTGIENLSSDRFGTKPTQRDAAKQFSVGSLGTIDDFSHSGREIKRSDSRNNFTYNKPVLANFNVNLAASQPNVKSLFDASSNTASKSPAESGQTNSAQQQQQQQRQPPAAHQAFTPLKGQSMSGYSEASINLHLRRAAESPALSKSDRTSGEQIMGQKLPPGFPLSPPSEAGTPSSTHISPVAIDPALLQLLIQNQLPQLQQLQQLRQMQQQQLCGSVSPFVAPLGPVMPLLPGVVSGMDNHLELIRRYQEEFNRSHFAQQLLQQSALKASLEDKSGAVKQNNNSININSDKKRTVESCTPRNMGDVQRPSRCNSSQSERPAISSVSPYQGPMLQQKFSHNVNGTMSLPTEQNNIISATVEQHFRESLQKKAAEMAKHLNGIHHANDLRSPAPSHGQNRHTDISRHVFVPSASSVELRTTSTSCRPSTATSNGAKTESVGYMFEYLPYTQKFVSQSCVSRICEQEQKSPATSEVRSPGPPALIKEMPTTESKMPRLESNSNSEALQTLFSSGKPKDIEAMKERIRIETAKQINLCVEQNTASSTSRQVPGHYRPERLLKVDGNEEKMRKSLAGHERMSSGKPARLAEKQSSSGLPDTMFGKPVGLPKGLGTLSIENLAVAALQQLGNGGSGAEMSAMEQTQQSNSKHQKRKSRQANNGVVNNTEQHMAKLLNIPVLSTAPMTSSSIEQAGRVFSAGGMTPLTISLPVDHSKILTSSVTSSSEHLSAPLLLNGQVINGALPLGGSVVFPPGFMLRPGVIATSANNIKGSSSTTMSTRFPLLGNSSSVARSVVAQGQVVPGLEGQTKLSPELLQSLQQHAALLQSSQQLQLKQQMEQQQELLRQQSAGSVVSQQFSEAETSMHSRKRSADSANMLDEASPSKRSYDRDQSSFVGSSTQPKYIDSFRSFVEHAVQRAFLRDEEASIAAATAKVQDDTLKCQTQTRVTSYDVAVNLSKNSSVVCVPVVSVHPSMSESLSNPSMNSVNETTAVRHLRGITDDKIVLNNITPDMKAYILSKQPTSASYMPAALSNSHESKNGAATLPVSTNVHPATFTQNPPSTVLKVTPDVGRLSLQDIRSSADKSVSHVERSVSHVVPDVVQQKNPSPLTVRQLMYEGQGTSGGQGQMSKSSDLQPSPPPLQQNPSSAFTPVSSCYRQSPPDLRRRSTPPQDCRSAATLTPDDKGPASKYRPLIRVSSAVSNDTDSDTRSASSPLSTASSATVPAKTGEGDHQPTSTVKSCHPKFKKTWLMRYADEDQNGDSRSVDVKSAGKVSTASTDVSTCIVRAPAQHCNALSNDEIMKESDVKTNESEKGDRKRRSEGKTDDASNAKQARSHSSESSTNSSTVQENVAVLRSRKKQISKDFSLETASNTSDISSSSSSSASSSHLCRDNESVERVTAANHVTDRCVTAANSRGDFDCVKKLASKIEELKKQANRDDLSAILASKPLNVMNESECKSSHKPFLQSGSCVESTPRLVKCRECKVVRGKKGKSQANIFCRFYAFRQLRYSVRKSVTVSGFSAPHEADAVDMEIWMPLPPVTKSAIQISTARYILENISSRFLSIVRLELEALHTIEEDQARCWKRAVQGVREMCDVCEAMLFNLHWVCKKCGYAVCMDCFLVKTNRSTSACADANCRLCNSKKACERWLSCTINRQSHEPDCLMLVQIVPSDVLGYLVLLVEDLIPKVKPPHLRNGIHPASNNCSSSNFLKNTYQDHQVLGQTVSHSERHEGFSSLDLLADAAVSQEIKSNMSSSERKADTQKLFNNAGSKNYNDYQSLSKTLTDVSQCRQQPVVNGFGNNGNSLTFYTSKIRSNIPNGCIISTGSVDQSTASCKVPHNWIDNGRILRLNDSQCASNIDLFQQQWLSRKPTLVSKCRLNFSLWQPDVLSRELGKTESELTDCADNSVHNMKLKRLFDGLERVSARQTDGSSSRARVLKYNKLEGDEFRDILPLCHQDLHNAFPLPEYTSESGSHNLVSRLPEFFVRPDLGPRLLIGYGQAREGGDWSSTEGRGTWNLSLEASDTCNVLTYVGQIKDDAEKQKKAAAEFVKRSVSCPVTVARLSEPGVRVGSVWHIYDPSDADKIRNFLNKVSSEKGYKRDQFYDPILAKSSYLTDELRDRLRQEYNVQTYTIVQCLGDAVLLPAGTPYQVCNLQSCINVAQDFISSEHLGSTLDILGEMRHQANTTFNYEDKLQVKNVIYHAIRDSLSFLDSVQAQ